MLDDADLRRLASRPVKDLLLLAGLMVINGDKQDAERVYQELLLRDPYNGPTRTGLGELYRDEGRWEEARAQLEVVLRYYPNVGPKVYLSLVGIDQKLGRKRDAEYNLRKAERIFPGDSLLVHPSTTD